ncbi:MAG: exo-alpha-sialidase [Acidobacteria bacterium]|nr:exo-alpha-sialidase [Acidobacteriota bacterium]
MSRFAFVALLSVIASAGPLTEIRVDSLRSTERIRVARDSGYFPRSTVTRGGAIVILYRANAGHQGPKGDLVSIRSTDIGRTWSTPVSVAVDPDADDRNPALGTAADGTLVAAFYWRKFNPADPSVPPVSKIGFVYSSDEGRSWTKPVWAPENASWRTYSPYGRILTLSTGQMVLPVYYKSSTWLLRSNDHGKTWGDLTLVSNDMNETAYAVLPSGEWVLVGRESNGHGANSLVRHSKDGRTWSQPTPLLTDRRLPSDLAVLSDGSLLAVHGYRTIPRGARAVRSIDSGKTWLPIDYIIHDRAERNTDTGYPSVEVVNGWVVICFYDASNAPDGKADPKGAFLEVVRIRESELLLRR